jgi:hypothetical protein
MIGLEVGLLSGTVLVPVGPTAEAAHEKRTRHH